MATITGTDGNDLLPLLPTEANGDDTINGLGGNDILVGYSGNDTLIGGTGSDLLIGGVLTLVANVGSVSLSGNDTADYSASSAGVTIDLAQRDDLVVNLLGLKIGLENAVAGSGGDAQGDILAGIANLTGSGSVDRLSGDGGANILRGNAGADMLFGNGGDDVLNGGKGADTMEGGAGNDTFYVDDKNDRVVERNEAGVDRVNSSISFSLKDKFVEVLDLGGSASINATGNSLNNKLFGNNHDNVIAGGTGNDKLTGAVGHDTFVFDTTLNKDTNVDAISDFEHEVDRIQVDHDVFVGLGAGVLAASAFKDTGAAGSHVDGSDRILYNSKTGDLFFDRDGDHTTYGAVKFAHLDNHSMLTAADFIVA